MAGLNQFEAEARAAKVSALVRCIDRELASLNLSPADVASFLRKRDDAWWCALARSAGLIGKSGKVLTPSTLTRDCVIAEFEARAEEPTPDDMEEIVSW